MSYLQHYAKGTESDNHSYTKREYINGKWVYYYGDGGMNNSTNRQNNYSNGSTDHSYKTAKIKGDMNDFKEKRAYEKVQERKEENRLARQYQFKGAIQKGKDKIRGILDKIKGKLQDSHDKRLKFTYYDSKGNKSKTESMYDIKRGENSSQKWRDAAKKYNAKKKLSGGRK